MGYNAQVALNEAQALIGKATYSMEWNERDGQRLSNGTVGYDCSGFVYHLLNVAGAIDDSYLKRSHYTGTLKQDLEAAGFVEVSGDKAQAGDIYIWGNNYGASAGGAAHTGIMTSDVNQISACYYTLGAAGTAVQELGHDFYWGLDGKPEYHFFHYNGDGNTPVVTVERPKTQTPQTSIDKFKNGGNEFVLGGWFTIQDVQQINGIWQVRADELAKLPFDWTDNGIPCRILENSNGNANFNPGDKVRFKKQYNSGTIDEYDVAENAVGIDYISGYGRIWYDADKFWEHA